MADVKQEIYAKRRAKFFERIKGGVAIVFSAEENHSTAPFKQESDFAYLTGFPEASAIAVFKNVDKPEYTLFVKPQNEFDELWTGKRIGVDNSIAHYGANFAFPADDFANEIPKILKNAGKLFYTLGEDSTRDSQMLEVLKKVKSVSGRTGRGLMPIYDLAPEVGELRIFKDETELQNLRKAIDITAKGLKHVREILKPGVNEYEVIAALIYEYTKNGGCHGFAPIVAGGRNATILHYPDGSMPLKDGELVLVDTGSAFAEYSSDITRTFAVNGKFSKEQAEVYNAVLRVQEETIKMIKPGVMVKELQDKAISLFEIELKNLGIIDKNVKGEDAVKEVKKYYPHNLSHWLGLNTHDAGLYVDESGNSRKLEAGMVLTVEPGLYIRDEKCGKYNGIGVRIEDDILVTKDGYENLSISIPKKL